MLWNGAPSSTRSSIIKWLRNNTKQEKMITNITKKNYFSQITLTWTYTRWNEENVLENSSFIFQNWHCFALPKKILPYSKNQMLMIAQHVWNGNYIGKTGRNFVTHLKEHRSCDDQHMYKRISKSEQFIDIVNLMKFRILIPWLYLKKKENTCCGKFN